MKIKVHFRCILLEKDLTVHVRQTSFTPSLPRKHLLYKGLL